MAGDFGQVRTSRLTVQWFQQQPIRKCINEMLASVPKGNIFNGLYSFIQNNSQTGFIRIMRYTEKPHIVSI
jgi:hypothetical protein